MLETIEIAETCSKLKETVLNVMLTARYAVQLLSGPVAIDISGRRSQGRAEVGSGRSVPAVYRHSN